MTKRLGIGDLQLCRVLGSVCWLAACGGYYSSEPSDRASPQSEALPLAGDAGQ